ncbi:nucleotidyltransferase [Marinobacterium nitratireducens]|uniref:Nucleotidyltransferase n=1 Tax=Marinobacterium nitratireducens TaxID=518897 RepID=A0A917ZEM6_9GAMM|nr:nucleotidyltransferase substrate binding protein [Marinobacterium nitratireducens]GGO81621.1 nucleotidyltransferase [Marinobacterium nitratireducens]
MLDLSGLERALSSLDAVIAETQKKPFMDALTEVQRNAFIAGAIQNFEFTYELCWKFMKRWLDHNLGSSYVEGVSRRELFRLAHQSRLIDSVDEWMLYHRARNQTSHIYDPKVATEVYEIAVEFLPAARALLSAISAKND